MTAKELDARQLAESAYKFELHARQPENSKKTLVLARTSM